MRTFAMGDPQASFDTVMAVLDAHRLLAGERLAADVHLISIGDHFDYDFDDVVASNANGLRTLAWLASHDAAQTTILLGNHDISRVMELATVDDATFAAARSLARSSRQAEFGVRYPELVAPGLVARDFASFTVAQRDLVVELLLARRMRLATTATLPDGRDVLLTHAGVTDRELAILGPVAASPAAIAAALDGYLERAVDACRAAWERGPRGEAIAPLGLAPLHVAGIAGEEGGGLLYHRPSNPERPGVDRAWELAVARPRRFHPRTLPRGLTQIAGHTGHHKALEELGEWA
ncbi:MAG: transcriptional regulator, partial [Proteobacteria bacterium]|nr:transcriptional regulator [Pseudomonadota bacterium]